MTHPWFIHFYREFGEWLQEKTKPSYVTKCDICNRLAISDPERFSKEYCRKMRIQFKCGSCIFPQYKDTLCTPTRGNVERIYGKTFNPKQNKWISIYQEN